MENLIKETIKPAIEFLNEIKPKDKVAIVHAHDNDSICSAAIIYKLLKDFHNIDAKFIVSDLNFAITESVLKTVKKMKPDHIIAVDIAEVNVSILTGLRNISRVMIIDHHTPRGYVMITYVNPRVFDRKVYFPATYLCYKIYENFLDVKDILWIAGVGTLSDMGMKNCPDLFEDIKQNNRELVENNRNVDEVLFDNSRLGELAKIFDSARVVNGVKGSVAALTVLVKTKNYQDVLGGKSANTKKLLKWYDTSEKEFNRLVKDFDKKKKTGNLVVYEIKSKYNMKSSLATFLSRKVNKEVLVIYQKFGKYVDVSFRRGKKSSVDLSQLASISVRGIPDSNGGGHPVAAGAKFQAKYKNSFLNNLKQAFYSSKKA